MTLRPIGIAALLLVSVGACVSGCRNPPRDAGGDASPPLGEAPAYAELAQQHNERLSDVVGFYTTATVEVTWMDEKGEPQREVGEGNLIFTRPDQVALTFRKLGEVYLWIGGGPQRSWMLWGGDVSKAFIARNENVFTGRCEEFPIPLLPAELVDLYGVFELPADAAGEVRADEARRAWVVETQARWCRRRVWFEPERLRPIRVELLDGSTGRVWASSELSAYQEMEIRGVAPGRQPHMPTKVIVRAGDFHSEGTVSLTLFNPADVAPGHTRINPVVFDFDAIRRNMRPREVIVLDAASESPALPAEPEESS